MLGDIRPQCSRAARRRITRIGRGSTDNRAMLKTDSPSRTVRVLTLDRPDRLNAMTAELCGALHEELDRTAADRSCRAVVLTGAGRAFCVGLDLAGYGEAPGNDGTDPARDRLGNQEQMSRLILRLRDTPQPVIAAVNGPAAGAGLSLACACDMRIAADDATFIPAFVNIGLVPDSGGTYFVRRLIGTARAFELFGTGHRLTAAEAHAWGLVNEVVESGNLAARAAELAAELAALPTRAVGMTKRLFDHADHATLHEQLAFEAKLQAEATQTADFHEGVAAFLEKREPRFQGS